ncbi:c-type cytochrome [Cyanobium sp. ATX-6F1]|uniref:c-type cytochrome n=1 Tax=Cyanobium sp. ATX-6F1 TaxID=3137388 RepID=UPI0039BE73D1
MALLLGFALLVVLWPLPAGGLSADDKSAQGASGQGARLFANHCAACHINGGNIIRRSQTLKLKALERRGLASAEAIALVAANGLGQMGGYGEALGPGGAEAVGAWVWQQAQKAWIQG